MTRVTQSWDIRSTSDIRSNWGYRRTGSDMNELYEIPNPTFGNKRYLCSFQFNLKYRGNKNYWKLNRR